MEKEFEALDFLKQQAIAFEHSELAIKVANENHTIVEQALTELKEIKEAKPSEAMEILLKAKQERLNFYGRLLDNDEKFFETLELALLKAQEQEKVLEILFKKQVDLGWLWYCIHECVNSLNEYNKKMPIEKFKLTEEEFDLLKRWSEK